MYVCVENTIATLYQQYRKYPPKILQEEKVILKLKPETKQVSVRLSETCTHQHLDICDAQVCPAVRAGVLTRSSQWSDTPVLLSTHVESRICCDDREDREWQLSSP